mmetsp:Transcript_2163/g.3791  ORF Transcript_2163/g.3791 Transcript_2163/m.3791 type:complete len:245 (+) Transcript_2163:245-979(+)
MACGGQHAPALRRLVHRCAVRWWRCNLGDLAGHKGQGRQRVEQHLGLGLPKLVGVIVPRSRLEEHPLHKHAVQRRHLHIVLAIHHVEVKVDEVDGDSILSGVVLLCPRQECLSEEEAREPIDYGRAVVQPRSEEVAALDDLLHVRPERLQAGEAPLEPELRHLAVEQPLPNDIHLLTHQDKTPDGLFQVLHAVPDDTQQNIRPAQLLAQHCVHALAIRHRILRLRSLDVEVGGEAFQDVTRRVE